MASNVANMGIYLYAPKELMALIASRVRARRLSRGMRQSDLAVASGISIQTVQRLETSGKVAFEAIVRVALALRAEREFAQLFAPTDARSLDEILEENRPRKRARKPHAP